MSDNKYDTSTLSGKISVMSEADFGAMVQTRVRSGFGLFGNWGEPSTPNGLAWNWELFDYRVAPKKKLVPWDVTPALIGKMVKHKKDFLAYGISTVNLKGKRVLVGLGFVSAQELLDDYVELTWNVNEWVESPCGTEVTE